MPYTDMTDVALQNALVTQQSRFQAFTQRELSLNMARGKPSSAQLDLSLALLDTLSSTSDYYAEDGTDCRNYGVLYGLPEARRLMATLLDDDPEHVLVGGNSSLSIMYDLLAEFWLFGTLGSAPWNTLPKVKWLCPVPGYDRHFAITESFGMEMIPVPLSDDGPDMDLVETLVSDDDTIKGIWCVPTYSNPSGITYSDDTVRRLAAMKCAAEDFRILWDNAYCVHHLFDETDTQEHVLDIARTCLQAGNPHRACKFASTSKITFPGAGIAAMAASEQVLAEVASHMGVRTIGYDKLNQLRHVRFLQDAHGIATHMSKHAALIRPKFELVWSMLEDGLKDTDCTWTKPRGGYFILFQGPQGTAHRIVELAASAGVKLTAAGAPFPLGIDPNDAFIRLAPTLPTEDELKSALEVFICCAQIACIEAELAQRA